MRLVSYRTAEGTLRAGLVTDGFVVDLQTAGRHLGLDFSADLLATLTHEDDGVAAMRRVAEAAAENAVEAMPLAAVTLGPVLPRPPKILLLAGNYQSHILEAGNPPLNKAEVTPRFFIKPGTAVIGTGEAIKVPPVSETVDYEIEIAAVIGRRGRDIAVEEAGGYVVGYTIFNDISARHLSVVGHRVVTDRNRERYRFFDWLVGKWCDTFAVVGSCLTTVDEIADVTALEMALTVNGELRQHSSAGEMIFTVPEAIAWISSFVTLEPGDLICMGTPGGVGETTETYLRPGDVVEAEIEQLGKLVNTVV